MSDATDLIQMGYTLYPDNSPTSIWNDLGWDEECEDCDMFDEKISKEQDCDKCLAHYRR
jgi:hypothetical protein